MIITKARDVVRVAMFLVGGAVLALIATAVFPAVGVVIAVVFWLVLAAWLVAALADPARRSKPYLHVVVTWLVAHLGIAARWVRRGRWVRMRVAIGRVRLWTRGGMTDHRRSSVLALSAGPRALGAAPVPSRRHDRGGGGGHDDVGR